MNYPFGAKLFSRPPGNNRRISALCPPHSARETAKVRNVGTQNRRMFQGAQSSDGGTRSDG